MPKVSIVIPVYNVEPYLRECLDSVVSQTLDDIEIICVDDGSTDGCPRLLDEYAASDSRIKVIHKPNGGYGQAMNTGMDAASGEYIGIVDSDDFILPDMYETLYTKATEHRLDFVKSDFFWYWGRFNYSRRSYYAFLESHYNRVLECDERSLFWSFGINNWTGIYRRDFLISNGIRHNESPGASYQDTGFRVLVMAMAKRGMWIDKAFYMYRQDNPAASVKSREKMLSVLREYEYASSILSEKGLFAELELCNACRMSGHMFTLNRIADSLKREYAHIIRGDYLKLQKHIAWDKLIGYEPIREWVRELSSDPDAFCDRMLEEHRATHDRLQSAKGIILYGAGKLAVEAYIKLTEAGFADKLLFAVESAPEKGKRFFGLEVKEPQSILKREDAPLVLVAVHPASVAYHQITKLLRDMGVDNYMDSQRL